MNSKLIFSFGNGIAEGNASMRDILGGKGANLAEMCNLSIPVPYGFTISSDVCKIFYNNDNQIPIDTQILVLNAITDMERKLNKKFGDSNNPLLVSIRSGARVSMPGMMDTVLNLGLNDNTVEGLANITQNSRFAYDSYRRFYSNVFRCCA